MFSFSLRRRALAGLMSITVVVGFLGSGGARAADRVALVIGMAQYRNVPALSNTVNDARLLSATLSRIGFDVTTLIDTPQEELREELDKFAFR
ncbi:MAG: caspase family protein, partial [Rhodobacteraceae bacterium]|nr:caspase family protein [Paracoccaceae bacterium]